jgi:hypothetical protein
VSAESIVVRGEVVVGKLLQLSALESIGPDVLRVETPMVSEVCPSGHSVLDDLGVEIVG